MYELKVGLWRERMKQEELTHQNRMINNIAEIKNLNSSFLEYKHQLLWSIIYDFFLFSVTLASSSMNTNIANHLF